MGVYRPKKNVINILLTSQTRPLGDRRDNFRQGTLGFYRRPRPAKRKATTTLRAHPTRETETATHRRRQAKGPKEVRHVHFHPPHFLGRRRDKSLGQEAGEGIMATVYCNP